MYRKLSVISVFILGIATLFIFGAGVVQAQTITSGDNLTVPANRTVDGSYIAAGRSIDIGGTVNGDVICGTQTLNISGTVTGDVLCGAQTVTITGRVEGSVRLAAQSVNLSGPIGRNASIAAQSLDIGSGSTIGGDLSYAGSSLTSNGQVSRDIAATVQTATIAGAVGRNVNATVDRLSFASGAEVGGTVRYTSDNKASVANGAEVANLQQNKPVEKEQENDFSKGFTLFWLLLALATLFAGLILVLLVPRFFYATSEEMYARPGWTILAGFIVSVVLPALIVLCMLTVIGIPLGLGLMFLVFALTLLSYPVTGFFIGRWLFGKRLGWSDNAIVLMLLGMLVLLILLWIPILGFIVWMLTICIGFGSMFRAFRHRYERPEYSVPKLQT